MSVNHQVNQFLEDLSVGAVDQFYHVVLIRDLFLQSTNEIEESIQYGGLVFKVLNMLVGGIYVYKSHISIEFSDGVSFADPSKMLEGSGKKRRHLKIASVNDIEEKSSLYYIKQAVQSVSH